MRGKLPLHNLDGLPSKIKMLTNCNIAENIASDIVGHGSEVIICMTITKIEFEICLAKFGHKPDEKFDFLFVFNMPCHVSAFSILCI